MEKIHKGTFIHVKCCDFSRSIKSQPVRLSVTLKYCHYVIGLGWRGAPMFSHYCPSALHSWLSLGSILSESQHPTWEAFNAKRAGLSPLSIRNICPRPSRNHFVVSTELTEAKCNVIYGRILFPETAAYKAAAPVSWFQ